MLRDLRYAMRSLLRTPAFALIAVVTLALGIGANTAVYSIVRGLLWRPLPFPEADRLITVRGANPGQGIEDAELSLADLADLRRAATGVTALAGFYGQSVAVTGRDGADRVQAFVAEPALFDVVGIRAALGRAFQPADGAAGAARVAVLSHGLWQRLFGGDPAIVGRAVTINGVARTVVGVMPARFHFLPADLWLPLTADVQPPREDRYAMGVARLAPGASVEAVREELVVAAAQLEAAYPVTNRGWTVEVHRYREDVVDAEGRLALGLMMGAVGVVLLIACANVAGLMLARAAARSRELAVRAAVGASRWRIARQLLAEALVLAVAGGGLGVVLARWWNDALLATLPAEDLPGWMDASLDMQALAVTVAATLGAAILFGLFPALRASRPQLVDELRGGGRGIAGGAGRLRQGLVVAQVALSVVLLAAAMLFTQSFLASRLGHLGFDDRGVVTARAYLGVTERAERSARVTWMRDAVARVAALPGIQAVALTGPIPGDDGGDRQPLDVEGQPRAPDAAVHALVIPSSAGLFAVLGTPLRAGRDFTAAEAEDSTASVAIVGARLAALLWPNADPLGRRVRLAGDTAWLRVIGVAPDLQYEEFGEDTPVDRLQLHVPYARASWRSVSILARSGANPAAQLAPMRVALRGVDRAVPVYALRTMRAVRSETTAGQRVFVLIFGTFGAQALVMTAVGLYGLLAFGVAQRRREIGVRMALGARVAGVVRMVVGQAATLTALGLVVGLGGALAVARVLRGVLFGLSGSLTPLAMVAAVLLGTAVVAALVPARRAARVDPMEALRSE